MSQVSQLKIDEKMPSWAHPHLKSPKWGVGRGVWELRKLLYHFVYVISKIVDDAFTLDRTNLENLENLENQLYRTFIMCILP